MLLMLELGRAFYLVKPDTALQFVIEGAKLARKIGFDKGEMDCLRGTGTILNAKGIYPAALTAWLQALKIAERIHDNTKMARITGNLSILYNEQNDTTLGIEYAHKAISLAQQLHDTSGLTEMFLHLATTYKNMKHLDSALFYNRLADITNKVDNDPLYQGSILSRFGDLFLASGRLDSAMVYYKSSVYHDQESEFYAGLSTNYLGIATVFLKQKRTDSCLYYAKLSYNIGKDRAFTGQVLYASQFLANYYDSVRNIDSAYVYLSAAVEADDSLYSQQKANQLQSMTYDETVRQLQIEDVKKEEEAKAKQNALIGGLATLLLVAFLLVRNNRQKQKANCLLKRQKHDIEDQRDQTNQALAELQQTQAQLVQSEKMASLGELTAGIAHEIQNPLNFVNNFSEVNTEMIDELQAELKSGNTEEAIAISNDIKENEEKISHHGKRADAIVKGMLQHSSQTKGVKEPTDIIALCDEYLRLSYHGLRAKEKNFNVDFKTDFDESIGKINIVPQDIGRVLLNLYNNAFYAVNERQKAEGEKYKPEVSVQTKKLNDKVEIRVEDNGNGIPEKVIDKIFQPFFTTKPAGQGTGLGLSLGYDIIKAHNGKLQVESKEGQGTTFIIQL